MQNDDNDDGDECFVMYSQTSLHVPGTEDRIVFDLNQVLIIHNVMSTMSL